MIKQRMDARKPGLTEGSCFANWLGTAVLLMAVSESCEPS